MVAFRAIGIGAAVGLAAASPSAAQQVVDLYGVTEATLQWGAATGQVAGYYVIVARNGGAPSVYGVSTDTLESVKASLGDSLTVQVAAFDAKGVAGPVSAASDTFRFNPASSGGGGTTTPPPPPPTTDPDPTPPPDTTPPPPPADGGVIAAAVRLDYTGDGHSDVLLRDSKSGALSLWTMQGAQVLRQTTVPHLPYPWIAKASGDFDGDGHSDLLWRNNDTGQLNAWMIRAGNVVGGAALTPPGFTPTSSWKVEGAADFDGDGREDIAIANRRKGLLQLLLMNGPAVASRVSLKAPSADWQLVAMPDADGDGIAELVWENQTSHELRIESLAAPGTQLPLLAAPTPWRVLGYGDVNGDGRDDLLVRHKDTRQVQPLLLTGARATLAAFSAKPAESKAEMRGVGDFDSDGRADALWSNPSGAIEIWFGGANAFRTVKLTNSSGGLALVGDDEN